MNTIANPSPTVTALVALDGKAKAYADARRLVAERVTNYEDAIADVNRRLVPGIKSAAANASNLQAELSATVQANAGLFVQPKSMTLHGIKVGFQKGKGSIDWIDDEQVCEKIISLLGTEQAELLIKTTRKPIAKALQALDVKTLRKLGCTVEDTGDYVFVKATDSAVDKLVAEILKEGAIEEVEGKK